MLTTISICSLLVLLASVSLIVYAFYHILLAKQGNENDLNVIQRQIRGFALLILANLVMLVGGLMCAGTFLPYVMDLIR